MVVDRPVDEERTPVVWLIDKRGVRISVVVVDNHD